MKITPIEASMSTTRQTRRLVLCSQKVSMISASNSVIATERNIGISAMPSAAASPME